MQVCIWQNGKLQTCKSWIAETHAQTHKHTNKQVHNLTHSLNRNAGYKEKVRVIIPIHLIFKNLIS